MPAAIFQACAQRLLSGTRYWLSACEALSSALMSLLSLRQLQGANVAHDRPAIVDRDLRAVRGHGANAVRDGGEELAIRHLPNAVLVKAGGWWLPAGAKDDRALSGAGTVVAGA